MATGTPKQQGDQTKIPPVEDFIKAGIVDRMRTVFGAPFIFATADDKLRALAKLFEGKPVKYPYGFLTLDFEDDPNSYNAQRLARFGLPAIVADGHLHNVRLLPTLFNIEVEFITPDYNEVIAFVKRWRFAKRLGFLKFNVNYGKLSIPIGCETQSDPKTPPRGNVTETESQYVTTGQWIFKGYQSEDTLRPGGVIQTLDASVILEAMGSNAVFMPFNKE